MSRENITAEERKAFDKAKHFNLGRNCEAVTPDDDATFDPSAIRVDVAGTLVFKDTRGKTSTVAMLAGQTLECLATAVLEASTATGINRIW